MKTPLTDIRQPTADEINSATASIEANDWNGGAIRKVEATFVIDRREYTINCWHSDEYFRENHGYRHDFDVELWQRTSPHSSQKIDLPDGVDLSEICRQAVQSPAVLRESINAYKLAFGSSHRSPNSCQVLTGR